MSIFLADRFFYGVYGLKKLIMIKYVISLLRIDYYIMNNLQSILIVGELRGGFLIFSTPKGD